MSDIENPLEELRKLREDITFSSGEVESMIESSKKVWKDGSVIQNFSTLSMKN